MYETRLLGSGSRTPGLAGLGAASRGPLDVVLNGAVALLLGYLALTLVEPFWDRAMEGAKEVRLEGDFKTLTTALRRYELSRGRYPGESLRPLEREMSSVPDDPWGRAYRVDPMFSRVLTAGPDGEFGLDFGDPAGEDDAAAYYKPMWSLGVVVEEFDETVPYLLRADGTGTHPVIEEMPAGLRDLAYHSGDDLWAVTRWGSTGWDLGLVPGDLTGAARWVLTGQGRLESPTFTRDGSSLYLAAVKDAPEPLLYRVDADGGELEQVTLRPSLEARGWVGDRAPDIDPVNGHLAFHAVREEGGGLPRICFVPRGRPGEAVRLAPASFPAGRRPRWSPDGKTFTYLHQDGQQLVTGSFPPRGKPETRGLDVHAIDFVLSPGGGQVAVLGRKGEETELWVIDHETDEARLVLRLAGSPVSLSRAP